MEQFDTPRATRWVPPAMPALEITGWPRQRALVLAQLWPVFGVLVLLCAALWGIGEYAAYKADLRRAETGRYLAEFREPPVGDAWRHLSSVWQAEERRQNTLLVRMAGLSGAELEAALQNYRYFVLDTVEDHRLAGEIDSVRSFFSRLALCIRAGNCDSGVATAQLGPAAWQFRNQHYDYFAEEGLTAEVDRVTAIIAPKPPGMVPGPLAFR